MTDHQVLTSEHDVGGLDGGAVPERHTQIGGQAAALRALSPVSSGARVLAGSAGPACLDEGRSTSAGVNAVARRAVAFFIDVNPAATFVLCTGEHGALGVLRHPDLRRPSLVCVGQHVTPGDVSEQNMS